MTDILDQPRDIIVGDRSQRFSDYAHLVDIIEIEIEVIQRAEAELETNQQDAAEIWDYIATHTACLEALLGAQAQWLAEQDAIIGQELKALRAEIRNLTSKSHIDRESSST
jgi:hypothetical protein